MEVLRYSAHQDINNSSMCDPTQRSCEPRRKRTDERNAPPEMARIITDPATGKCYCRGKVLGKVVQTESLLPLLDLFPQTKPAPTKQNLFYFLFYFPGRFCKMLRDDRPLHQ